MWIISSCSCNWKPYVCVQTNNYSIETVPLEYNYVQIISIRLEYLKPYNCMQHICIRWEYLKPYN